MLKHPCIVSILLCFAMISAGIAGDGKGELASQAERLMRRELELFYPACIDRSAGGFFTNFSNNWKREPQNTKFIVSQARLTWTAAEVARRRPDLAREYKTYALHGLQFLIEKMWDQEFGGFHWKLDQNGNISPHFGTEKNVYGIAFGIFAAANVYQATGDKRAIDLAIKAFQWLDKHARDRKNGGYFEALARDGSPLLSTQAAGRDTHVRDYMDTPYGGKSMNIHIHVLEAFTKLYQIWPEQEMRARLLDIFNIVRDKIVVSPGCMNQFFTAEWRAVPGADSYGHDVETAFLLLEAAEALGMKNDPMTLASAKSLVDHSLDYGYDYTNGGLYDEGGAFGPIYEKRKVWWSQAECANALSLMHTLFGNSDKRYLRALLSQWNFIIKYQWDNDNGGWFVVVSPSGIPMATAKVARNKAADSKVTYHSVRAMLNIADRFDKNLCPTDTQ